jgi:hypothetical protein
MGNVLRWGGIGAGFIGCRGRFVSDSEWIRLPLGFRVP